MITLQDIAYGPHDKQKFDLYLCDGSETRPLIVQIHGGGFSKGDKRNLRPSIRDTALELGMHVAAVNYRLVPEVKYPTPFEDTARAVQTLRAKAPEWHIDPLRIAACGGSAGGGMALWLALGADRGSAESEDFVERQSTRLQAVFCDDAQTSYDPRYLERHVSKGAAREERLLAMLGISEEEIHSPHHATMLDDVNMVNMVTCSAPPIFLWYWTHNHPLNDDTSSRNAIHHPQHGRQLKQRMDAVGAHCVLRFREELDPLPSDEATQIRDRQGVQFVARTLVKGVAPDVPVPDWWGEEHE